MSIFIHQNCQLISFLFLSSEWNGWCALLWYPTTLWTGNQYISVSGQERSRKVCAGKLSFTSVQDFLSVQLKYRKLLDNRNLQNYRLKRINWIAAILEEKQLWTYRFVFHTTTWCLSFCDGLLSGALFSVQSELRLTCGRVLKALCSAVIELAWAVNILTVFNARCEPLVKSSH